MNIRRPTAAVFLALALAGGGVLSACADPSDSTTGTPRDTATNTSGANPGSVSQGNVPSEGQPGQSDQSGRDSNDDPNQ